MAKIDNINFFKNKDDIPQSPNTVPLDDKASPQTEAPAQPAAEAKAVSEPKIPRVVQLPRQLMEDVKTTANDLNAMGFRELAIEVSRIYRKVVDNHFTVAVVGEFSRGKSTLINRLLGKDVLPVADLPTTALMTRITYAPTDKLAVYGTDGKKIKDLPLSPKSWEGLSAANFGQAQPEGRVVVDINNEWLGKYGIDIIDTPGAGDLEEKRAKVIEHCMVSADAAIITISAASPLSMTEQTFIRRKIMSRAIPFMAIALTKLDQINPDDRAGVINYIHKKLESLNIRIPIVIADDSIEIPGDKHSALVGMEKLRGLILKWMSHEDRKQLMHAWLKTNILNVLNSASAMLTEQKAIFDAKDVDKERMIAQRSNALASMHDKWQELIGGIKTRCETCINAFMARAQEGGHAITENLQHEIDRMNNPKEWLDRDYAYRVKRELNALSLSLDNMVAKQVATDLRWLNKEVTKQFKELVGVEPEGLMSSEEFRPNVNGNVLNIENAKNTTFKNTLITSGLTLGAALLLGATPGAPVILATLGVGSISNVLSRRALDKKLDTQRQQIKELIAQQMPSVINEASEDSALKIKVIYNDIIKETLATESRWMQTQRNIIRQTEEAKMDKNAAQVVTKKIEKIEALKNHYK